MYYIEFGVVLSRLLATCESHILRSGFPKCVDMCSVYFQYLVPHVQIKIRSFYSVAKFPWQHIRRGPILTLQHFGDDNDACMINHHQMISRRASNIECQTRGYFGTVRFDIVHVRLLQAIIK